MIISHDYKQTSKEFSSIIACFRKCLLTTLHFSFFILVGVATPNIMYDSAQSLENNYLRITALHFIEQFFLCIRDYEYLTKISTAKLPYSSLWYYPFL